MTGFAKRGLISAIINYIEIPISNIKYCVPQEL